MSVDATARRRGAHSMERIDPPDAGLRGWKVYAGDLGHYLGVYRSKADAKDALDTWHYFHPEEQRDRDRVWVEQFIQFVRGAADEDGLDGVHAALDHFYNRHVRAEVSS